MYLTVEETAEYLSLAPEVIKYLIQEKKIRALFDGEQYIIYKDQFDTHLEQVELIKKQIEEYLSEPISEDIDIKDED
ncbi:excisionase family DNA-binding protein [Mangrovibacillus cuniculi]|uniref:Excisionase family DNA-binding protein n=1 Tax=Mangrovibacillus cuniculi TaxID=2593652 RepID=A0A7S8HEQ0_9BACI|nr:excisionase family DNA-binding protein [Mangrovibacillus cuniculi]QPC45711.1 excisionase family DNA-binding protein [Mangrovibacillus cuniculi]